MSRPEAATRIAAAPDPIGHTSLQMIPGRIAALRDPALMLALGVGALCTLLQAAGLDGVLRYDRDSILGGAWWSLLSGNFVHLGWSHLGMNLAGLGLVAALVWDRFRAIDWAFLIVACSLAVGGGLLWLNPEVRWYVGFSGTLHGLLVAGSVADLRVWPRSAALLLVGVAAKLGWEQVAGALPGSESVAGGFVVVDAHLYGAIAGAVLGVGLVLAGRGAGTSGEIAVRHEGGAGERE